MMTLNPNNSNQRAIYIEVRAGSLKEIAQQISTQLTSTGSALFIEDVLNALIIDVQYYAAWAVLEYQRSSTTPVLIDENVILHGYEWAIIEPVISAHCDLLQAKLTEGTKSLGGEGFGITESEAKSIYNEKRLIMQNEAFVEPPITFKSLE